jgi:hypothetical protein
MTNKCALPQLPNACGCIANAGGADCVVIELRETEVDALMRGGLLEQETRNDRNAVLKALYGHFSRTLGPTP